MFYLVFFFIYAFAKVWELDLNGKGKTDIHRFLKDHPNAMIEVYNPHCPHCKAFEKSFETISKKGASSAAFGRIDGTTHKKILSLLSVKQYPSFYFFKSGNLRRSEKYTGRRSESNMLNFVKTKSK